MKIEVSEQELLAVVVKQIGNLFIINESEIEALRKELPSVLGLLEENFIHSNNKYYFRDGEAYFSPFHSGQYCIFLYYLARRIAHPEEGLGDKMLADKLYYLNKALNSVDLFYEINLPAHFGVEHPLGSVMGRATYGDEFFFYQGCTVGGNHHVYPVIGDNVKMCANSTILGNSHIGNNVTLGAGALVKDQDVPENSNVFGQSPNLIIKQKKR